MHKQYTGASFSKENWATSGRASFVSLHKKIQYNPQQNDLDDVNAEKRPQLRASILHDGHETSTWLQDDNDSKA